MTELFQQMHGSNVDEASSNGAETEGNPPEAGLGGALRSITHDINNPLAIISGNAQLLLELAHALDLDPDIAKPIKDIEEASQRLAAMIGRLNALNDEVQGNG